ncbi:septal ring lytic transglycosylase RlpA family protein [Candidatus Peregrinibacteria bacterium]|nr:septal ring lytic transglycosylase RlpA family protein [Candidatus Peregrinibacteria bacterium]
MYPILNKRIAKSLHLLALVALMIPNIVFALDETEKIIIEDKATSEIESALEEPSDTTNNTETSKIDDKNKNFPEKIFPDVEKGNQYYLAIKYLKDNDLIHGYPDGLFRPYREINRAEALKVLTQAMKYQEFSPVEKPLSTILEEEKAAKHPNCNFPDVNSDQWFYEYVCLAFNNEAIEGYPDGYFRPAQTINKVEGLKIALIQSGLILPDGKGDNFADVTPNDWFSAYTQLAKDQTIFVPTTNNELIPDEKLNRGDFSLMIYRLIKSTKENSEYGVASYYSYSFEGANTASGMPFRANEPMAAHKSLPFGSKVKVTNLINGKSEIVEIVDRGPYIHGRIIDLSPSTFDKISSLSTGIANIEITPLD